MITTLEKVKTRLSILPSDVSQDNLLNQFILAVGARFNSETGRRLERTLDYVQEFEADLLHLPLDCYPVETVTRFELQRSAALPWEEVTPDYLLRMGCVLSLSSPLGTRNNLVRVTYTGGYVMPPAVPQPGQTALPQELESAAIEQIAQSHQLRASAGVFRIEQSAGTYWELAAREWVPWVRTVLRRYRKLV